MPALRSLRLWLIVMFGAVVATAMGVLFLYVLSLIHISEPTRP